MGSELAKKYLMLGNLDGRISLDKKLKILLLEIKRQRWML